MTSTLFQNILPEDIPVMLKRLNAYTKSYQRKNTSSMPVILRISSASLRLAPSMFYRTITTATAISQPPSPVVLCSVRLLPVRGFLIFLWTSWLRKTAP